MRMQKYDTNQELIQNVVQVEARVLAGDVDAKFSRDDLAIWSRTHNFVQEFATVEHVTYMIQPEWG